MTRRSIVGLMAALATVVSTGLVFAHPGHEHKVMGTVTMAAADHVMLKDKDGKIPEGLTTVAAGNPGPGDELGSRAHVRST